MRHLLVFFLVCHPRTLCERLELSLPAIESAAKIDIEKWDVLHTVLMTDLIKRNEYSKPYTHNSESEAKLIADVKKQFWDCQ